MLKPESFTAEIADLTGKTIKRAYQDSGQHHSLDGGYDQDGDVTLEFTDGTKLVVGSYWCNDDTSSTEFKVTCEAVSPS